jgi:UDP-glucose 4-epimerase
VLDFVPRHSDLSTVIRTAWAWHQKAHPLKAR